MLRGADNAPWSGKHFLVFDTNAVYVCFKNLAHEMFNARYMSVGFEMAPFTLSPMLKHLCQAVCCWVLSTVARNDCPGHTRLTMCHLKSRCPTDTPLLYTGRSLPSISIDSCAPYLLLTSKQHHGINLFWKQAIDWVLPKA